MTDNSNNIGRALPGPGQGVPATEPDAYGQAALLLAESILHAPIETRTLTPRQALEVVQVASEVKVEVAEQSGEPAHRLKESLALLAEMSSSLATELL